MVSPPHTQFVQKKETSIAWRLSEGDSENRRQLHAGAGPATLECIFIPADERGRPMSDFSVSVRLGHLLEDANVRLAGDLHGLSYVELGEYRNCGTKTLAELRELVRQLHAGTLVRQLHAGAETTLRNPNLLFVDPKAHALKVAELPVSVRLRNVLLACDCRTLGDLDRRDERDLLSLKNCGRTTIRELRELLDRAAAGDFSPDGSSDLASCLEQVIRAIDTGLSSASDRDRRIFEQRLAGDGGRPRTLEDVGNEFKMTRERVRQIVRDMMAQMRLAGGPRLAHALEAVARECEQRVCPLTPELCLHWLGRSSTMSERDPAFYVRVLEAMAPEIPAWSPGSGGEGVGDSEVEAVAKAVETWLRQGGQPSPAEVLTGLRAQKRFSGLGVGVFLAAIRRARNMIVDFPQPDRPALRLHRLRIADFARPVLAESPEPLTPEEIIERARARFGSEAIVVTGRSAENHLRLELGFYLLGPRSIGLRIHFRAAESKLPPLRDQFEQLLRTENRPVSTIEAINTARIEIPEGVNSYELAQILREDARFIDLGRHLFALTEWGVQEREYVKDLLLRVFAEAGRTLTIEQVLTRLMRFRSVSPTGLSMILRHHPEVRAYGFGYFGLRTWGAAETEVILCDRSAVERAVRQSEFPIRFSALCGLFNIGFPGVRANLLWKTCAASEKLRRAPDSLGPDTLLLHKAVSLEMALSAVMRALARPAPAYELQWELAAKYGMIFEHVELAQIEERLTRSSRFLRNATGEFLLDVDFDLEDFDVDALRAATIKTLSESREIADCDELIERLELQGFDLEDLSPDMLASILRGSDRLQEIGNKRFRAKE